MRSGISKTVVELIHVRFNRSSSGPGDLRTAKKARRAAAAEKTPATSVMTAIARFKPSGIV